MDTSSAVRWRKSARSASNGGACVEAALGCTVAVRDSKDPDGPRLAVSRGAWRAFTGSLQR